tara:strand:+ start:2071 stop:2265 length:195 start_codon:yes stop_codon:yes gene_type:complete
MKTGNLIRFKDHFYHEMYGVGVLLSRPHTDAVGLRWAFFGGENIMVREEEVEIVNETRKPCKVQ